MPEACGSTTPSIICTATAASIAEPPRFSTSRPGLDRQRMGGRDHLLRLCLRRPPSNQHRQKKDGKRKPSPHARRATMNRRRKGNSVMPSARVG